MGERGQEKPRGRRSPPLASGIAGYPPGKQQSMRVRNIARSSSEVRTRRILCKVLEKWGYRVNPSVGVKDVLEADLLELDGKEEWKAFWMGHFDFVITYGNDLAPQFVVEFDGPHHTSDPKTARSDTAKNKLCQGAGLPILRISSQELSDNERVPVLAWMVERWAAAKREYPALNREMQERWALLAEVDSVAPDTEEYWDRLVDCDPSVWFNLRHPYPARLTVAHRLRRLGVAGFDMTPREEVDAARAGRKVWARWIPTEWGDTPDPLFSFEWYATTCKIEVLPWEMLEPWPTRRALFSSVQTVKMRCALHIGSDAPSFHCRLHLRSTSTEVPIAPFWFTHFLGASRADIAKGLAEYLALRDIERWVREQGAAGHRQRRPAASPT
jgi:hypothetical protein